MMGVGRGSQLAFYLSCVLAQSWLLPNPASADDACLFNSCRKQYQANELGMRLEGLVLMRRLRLAVPDWMISALQPTAQDLSVGFDLQQLLASNIAHEPTRDVQQRLFDVHGSTISSSFALGARMAEKLFQSVSLAEDEGELGGIKTKTLFVEAWSGDAAAINNMVEQIGIDDTGIESTANGIEAIQLELCNLKERLNAKWQRAGFDCNEFLNGMKSVVKEAAALEASKKSADDNAPPGTLKLDVVLGVRNLVFKSGGRAVDGIDIWDFQDRRPVTADDVTIGNTAMAVRLGRDDDMAVVAAFRQVGDAICARYLYLPLRNGDNIDIHKIAAGEGLEAFSVKYGNNLGIAAIRHSDFNFLWDPSTTRDRANWHLAPPVPPAGVIDGRCS
ncbi:MAG TPA: hypothetical protein VNS34_13530 [Rhizobiaceae bacterium]|nr:hypothetical protein [Rhizobiaceae bacterium]